jgi:hypothetical protein
MTPDRRDLRSTTWTTSVPVLHSDGTTLTGRSSDDGPSERARDGVSRVGTIDVKVARES